MFSPICPRYAAMLLLFPLCVALLGPPTERANAQSKQKSIAGKADVLRHVPKKFATLTEIDNKNHRVKLLIEGEQQAKMWDVLADAELKVHGWWGRLKQFCVGDRVWVWFAIDRHKKRKGVLMLADELSEQFIHGLPHLLTACDKKSETATVESEISGKRQLTFKNLDKSALIGAQVFVQTVGKSARTIASQEDFANLRSRQREWLCAKWRQDGLPGTVSLLHPLSGEMEVMLDHEAIRWGRYLENGDKLTLQIDAPISAVVKHVHPWRERTLVRIVTASGVDQFDLSLGQRIRVTVPEPPADIQSSELPMDIGRLTLKKDRIEWFLASTYCSCKIAGDRCTGMFYSLASCNENACGMPHQIRSKVGELIDADLTDEQIWEKLIESRGPNVGNQHLLR